jgi:cathepsin L
MDCSDKFGNQRCNGGLVDAAFQYIKVNKGVDTEASYPYKAVEDKCVFNRSAVGATVTVNIISISLLHYFFYLLYGFVNIPKGNETALQIAIATVGPIAIAVDDTRSSFYFYSSGVYDEPACSTTQLAHTMIVVGYDTLTNGTAKQDYYIVKNSWGDTFGMKGYIWMSRNKNNQCGIATKASYPLV